jgi:hypothetical protein
VTARFYMKVNAATLGGLSAPILYEVEKMDPNAPEHHVDFNVVEPLPRHPASMDEIARLYWTAGLWVTIPDAPGIRCEEVVTSSPLRIIRQVS